MVGKVYGDRLERALDELARREADYQAWRVEQACQAAVQGGEYGVRVLREGTKFLDARPHHSVPYGQIREIQIDILGGLA